MKVRIVSTPPGDAPEEVRRAWIGVVLEGEAFRSKPGWHVGGVLTGQEVENPSGFIVPVRDAIAALGILHSGAAAWWTKWYETMIGVMDELVFTSSCYEVVEAEGINV